MECRAKFATICVQFLSDFSLASNEATNVACVFTTTIAAKSIEWARIGPLYGGPFIRRGRDAQAHQPFIICESSSIRLSHSSMPYSCNWWTYICAWYKTCSAYQLNCATSITAAKTRLLIILPTAHMLFLVAWTQAQIFFCAGRAHNDQCRSTAVTIKYLHHCDNWESLHNKSEEMVEALGRAFISDADHTYKYILILY